MKIGVGIGIEYIRISGDADASAFEQRVLAADGTFEAMGCLVALNQRLKSINPHPEVDAFQSRVLAASGIFEAKNCLVTFNNNLKGIS